MNKIFSKINKVFSKVFLKKDLDSLQDHVPQELLASKLASQLSKSKGSVLLVLAHQPALEDFILDLEVYLEALGDGREILILPEDSLSTDVMELGNDLERTAVLSRLATSDESFIVLTSSLAFVNPVAKPSYYREGCFTIKAGDEGWEPEDLAKKLVELDYDNEYQVNIPGEFARRGGVLDIYPPGSPKPLRLEFFGDEVDSIRTFDVLTQRSIEEVSEVEIVPRRSGRESDASILDYFENVEAFLLDSSEAETHVLQYFDDEQKERWESLKAKAEVQETDCDETAVFAGAAPLAPLYQFSLTELEDRFTVLKKQFLDRQFREWLEDGYEILVFCGNEGHKTRFEELLLEVFKKTELKKVFCSDLPLRNGLIFEKEKTIFLAENEIFGRVSVQKSKLKQQFSLQELLETEPELTAGDYAVHVAHGICQYHGLEIKGMDGEKAEFLKLEFAEDRFLYVPIDQIHLVTRYVGGKKAVPKLSKIGGRLWKNACEKAEAAANDFAAEMLRIQAVREFSPGHSFAIDNQWQDSFEEAFPYQETGDQLTAIEEVKADMERSRPMDRLLCGDVGFGKTEVAIRAAFKAVMDEKQVAIVVPTTVLAQQHFTSFSQRMADYPVEIAVLSRFVTKAEQKKILKKLEEGEVDIVVGTHRLLQKDVKYQRLGLVVIDEEQRFGVEAKEELKRMRTMVDILTMTATPIPRTLYMGLAGIRDLSTIMTPPRERKPVKTVVAPEEDEVIRNAILRELERGGQVFFLHNRVNTIEKRTLQIQRLVPEAKVGYGHGQMPEGDLEKVMHDFVEHKYDVLVSTTIIESGVDVPNANTIIIERADRFGLAALYQLRGRVGRYHHQAYCYLLLPAYDQMQDTAKQRINAIRKYTHLGAGFKLALRDLEIRGAGNLLGTSQSGHIAAVGFELYCSLLKRSVNKLSKQPVALRQEVHVNLGFVYTALDSSEAAVACFPQDYIEAEEARIDLYKKLNKLPDEKSLDDFTLELKDRFGTLPEQVYNLIEFSRIKILASLRDIHSVVVSKGRLLVENERGYMKINGKFPTLKETKLDKQFVEVQKILRKLKSLKK